MPNTYFFTFVSPSSSEAPRRETATADRLCDARDAASNGFSAWLAGEGKSRNGWSWGPWGLVTSSSS
jgi:hypothetical protein